MFHVEQWQKSIIVNDDRGVVNDSSSDQGMEIEDLTLRHRDIHRKELIHARLCQSRRDEVALHDDLGY